MSVTRHEICFKLPTLLPIAVGLQASAQDSSLPSAAFAFDKAPLHVANNNAQIRLIEGQTRNRGKALRCTKPRCRRVVAPTAHHHSHAGDVARPGRND
jgi:hypothetical protein